MMVGAAELRVASDRVGDGAMPVTARRRGMMPTVGL
jgi:hypothetical protein